MIGRSDCAQLLRDERFSVVHRDAVIRVSDSTSLSPGDSAQFAPCSLLIASPGERQEIDCKMPSNSR